MTLTRTSILLCSAAAGVAASWGGAALAQETASLAEVVVTAQRRSENLQNVPIAVVAITGAEAANRGVVSGQTLSQAVPSLNFERVPTASTPFLRGVGTPGSTIGNEPSVAYYLDDIYVPNGTAAAFDFNNIAAVEVLRGPQGTLFGRNATGGVIQIRTKDPTPTPTMDVTVGYANYDTRSGQIYASGGTERLAANVAAYVSDQKDGWGTNIITGHDTFRQYSWGARGKVRWESESGDTSAMLIGDVQRSKGDIGMPSRVRPGTTTRAGYNPDAAGAGFYDGTTNNDSLGKRYYDQLSGKFNHDFGPATFQSISSYSKTRFLQVIQDNDGSPSDFFNAGPYEQYQVAFTQEFQLTSAPDSPIQWSMGTYYYRDKSNFDLYAFGQAFGAARTAGIYGRSKTDSYSGYAQASGEILPRTTLTLGVRYTKDKRDYLTFAKLGPTIRSQLFYTKDSWDALTGRFSLDHKLRDNLMVYVAYNKGFKSGVFPISGLPIGPTPVLPPPAEPEDLNAYSAGFKSQFADNRIRLNVEAYYYDYKNIQVFNITPTGTLLLNGGAATIKGFDVDMVALATDNLSFTVGLNVQKGVYDTFKAGPSFFPQAPNPPVDSPAPGSCDPAPSYTLVNGYPTSTAAPGPGFPATIQISCDLSGNKTIQTPPVSFNVAADYDFDLGFGETTLTVAYSYRSKYYSEADNHYTTQQPTQNNVNASLHWVAPSGDFDVRLWGQNLTKEKTYSYIAQTTSGGTRYAPRAPRTYGVTLGYHY